METVAQEQVAAPGCTNVHTACDGYREGELSEGDDQGDGIALLIRNPHPSASVSSLQDASFCFHKGRILFWPNETTLSICLQKDTTEVWGGKTSESDAIQRDRHSVHTPGSF